MGLVRKILGPRSKYDKSLPYTYYAKVPAVEGDDQYFNYYFSDTICGLIERLDKDGISPDRVRIFGARSPEDVPIDTASCTTPEGKWLHRPEICRSLEERYKETREDRYKGHIEKDVCAFDDRDREGGGPF